MTNPPFTVIWSDPEPVDPRFDTGTALSEQGEAVTLSCPLSFYDIWRCWIGDEQANKIIAKTFFVEELEEVLDIFSGLEGLISRHIEREKIHIYRTIEVSGLLLFFEIHLPLPDHPPKYYEDIRESFLFRIHKTGSSAILDEHRELMRSEPVFFEKHEVEAALRISLPDRSAEMPQGNLPWRIKYSAEHIWKVRAANARARALYAFPSSRREAAPPSALRKSGSTKDAKRREATQKAFESLSLEELRLNNGKVYRTHFMVRLKEKAGTGNFHATCARNLWEKEVNEHIKGKGRPPE